MEMGPGLMFLLHKEVYIYLCLPAQISQLASDTRENISHFEPWRVDSVSDRLMNLKPKPTPCHSSVVPPTPAMARAWQTAGRCSLSSPGRFPNSLSKCCSFLCSSHPLSPQPLIPLQIFLPNTFVCPPRSFPQLWFRRHGCSHSLPALDQVTLPLRSHSPCEGAPCQA